MLSFDNEVTLFGKPMLIKRLSKLFAITFFAAMAVCSHADETQSTDGAMKHHDMMHSTDDKRISLGLSPKMKQHQLSNMRSHLEAVQAITGLIAEKEFQKASELAYSRLGLTEQMEMMCNSFDNKDFTALGLAFHESGDALGDALKSGDIAKSLNALQATLGYCVQCHATYRQ